MLGETGEGLGMSGLRGMSGYRSQANGRSDGDSLQRRLGDTKVMFGSIQGVPDVLTIMVARRSHIMEVQILINLPWRQ